MPYIVRSGRVITIGATPGEIIVTSETGRLQAVSLIQSTDPQVPLYQSAASIFGEIWMSTAESPQPQPLILLASGYFGYQETIGWTGEINLQASDAIYARFYSPLNVAATLTVRVAS
jgi:hypothetical protein